MVTLRRIAFPVLISLILSASIAGFRSQPAAATDCAGASSYAWSGTVISYGVRDFTVAFCGSTSLNLSAGLQWKGNKLLWLALVEPDGTVHTFYGSGGITGGLASPLATGNWTLVVRNAGPSNVQFSAQLSFQ